MKGFKGIIGGLVIGVCTIVLAESVKNTPTSSFIMVIGSIMSIFFFTIGIMTLGKVKKDGK
jgi:hypothetical protein